MAREIQRGSGGRRRFDAVGLGYTALDYLGVVPHLPERNTKLEIADFTIQGGGPAATAMVTVRRLGAAAAYIGKVGDDSFGQRMLGELRAEGVDVSAVAVEKGAASQFAFIMVDGRSGERTILWTRGNVSRLETREVDFALVRSSRALLIDDLEPRAALAAAEAAREAGIPVVIDAGSLREGVRELLPLCDYIAASEHFSDQISGGRGVDAALAALLSFGAKAAVVTLGERGSAALADGERIDVPGFPVRAVDTTGAGDVFHGAFLFAVIRGWDLRRACIFSNAVAALKCRRLGGRAGIPGFDEAVALIATVYPELSFQRD